MFRMRKDPRGWPMPPNRSPVPRAVRVAAASPELSDSARGGYRRRAPSRTRGLLHGAAGLSEAAAVRGGFPPPLQVQRDSDPVGRAAAEIAVQLHRNLH